MRTVMSLPATTRNWSAPPWRRSRERWRFRVRANNRAGVDALSRLGRGTVHDPHDAQVIGMVIDAEFDRLVPRSGRESLRLRVAPTGQP